MKNKSLFRKELFWDVKIKDLDCDKNALFIIERVLNFGDKQDYEKIKKIYGLKRIKQAAKKINHISEKSLNFWSIVFNIPLDSFKCTSKFLNKKQSAFLTG